MLLTQAPHKDRDRRMGGLDPTGEAVGEVTKSYHQLRSRVIDACDCCSVRGGKGPGKDGREAESSIISQT